MGLLRALRLGLVDAALGHRELGAEAVADDVERLAHGHAGHGRRVGAHVGDEPDVALRRLDALVQALGDAHRPRGLKLSLRLASCWSVLVVNGGAGLRFEVRLVTLVTSGFASCSAAACRSAVSPSAISAALPSMRFSSAGNVRPASVASSASRVQYSRAAKARDLALAVDHQAHGDRLDAAGGQAAADLARQERAERVADQAVDDAARLLRVDEVRVDVARVRERLPDGALGDLAERHPAHLRRRHMGRLGDVPGDRLAFAVEVGGEVDGLGLLRLAGDAVDVLAAVLGDHVLGREVVVDVHAELALAGVLRQVADVSVGGEDLVVRPEIAFDRPRLGRRLHDHEVLGHGRECSTGSRRSGRPLLGAGLDARPARGRPSHWSRPRRPVVRPRGCGAGSPRRAPGPAGRPHRPGARRRGPIGSARRPSPRPASIGSRAPPRSARCRAGSGTTSRRGR